MKDVKLIGTRMQITPMIYFTTLALSLDVMFSNEFRHQNEHPNENKKKKMIQVFRLLFEDDLLLKPT